MTEFFTIRETVERTITIDGKGREQEVSSRTVSREEIGRRHEPDYVLGCDASRGQYTLTKDGKEIFSSRSQDTVMNRYSYLTGDPLTCEFWFQDADNPDVSWTL